jgi:acetyl-CoA carboxylase carboxyl transferase subunit alpha
MAGLKVPIIVIVIGEGGSGGALGIGVGDRVFVLENAYYSVISPEGCAAILWKERTKANKAAEALKLTSGELLDIGIIDGIISEPLGGAHRDPQMTAEEIKKTIIKTLEELSGMSPDEIVQARYEKYRNMGAYREG